MHLKVYKTTTKKVHSTVIGTFIAHHVELYCPYHPKEGPFRSKELQELVAPKCNFAYDAIVEIGKLRYLHHYQVEEIKEIFKEKYNIKISSSEIELLLLKFIIYLSIVHQKSIELIKAYIKAQGGYILHLDATCEGDSPKLASSIDSLSEFVLHSSKLRTENENEIAEFLKTIKKQFGTPFATLSDMGPGILKAVVRVFPECPHFICHFHFLRMIGKLLFKEENDLLRKKLSKAGISGTLKSIKRDFEHKFNPIEIERISQYVIHPETMSGDQKSFEILVLSLILWVLDYSSEAHGYGFPFDRVYLQFYFRLQIAVEHIKQILGYFPYDTENTKSLWKLRGTILEITNDKNLRRVVSLYKTKVEIFEKLRWALRSAPENENNGLRDFSISKSIKEQKLIQKDVDTFIKYLDKKISEGKNKNLVNSLKQVKRRIEKYYSMLFSDPIEIKVNGKKRVIHFHRTNNIIERHFRALSYDSRRINGKKSLKKNLRNMYPATPLAMNLKNKNYVKLIFGDEFNVANKFSQVDVEMVRQKLYEKKFENCSTSKKVKNVIRDPNFLSNLLNAFTLHINYTKTA